MSGQGKALLKCCQCCRNAHQQGSLTVNENLLCWRSAHMREIGFRTESGKFLLVEFGILGFPMRNTSQTLKNSESTNDWNPESKCYWQRLESSTWNPEFVTWNPESKFVLDSLRARFRTLVYFFFSPFPTPLCLGSKNPPRVLFPYALDHLKRENQFLWTGYRNSSYSFVAGCCISIVLCVLLSHDSRVSCAPYFGSCVALGYESPIFHRASEILRRAWKSPPVRMVSCWPAQPGILPWGKMWGEGGWHTWIPLIRPSSVIAKANTNWNLFVKLMIIFIVWIKSGKGLVSTQCRVNRTEMLEEGSCSHRTDKFVPCLKIIVSNWSCYNNLIIVIWVDKQRVAFIEQLTGADPGFFLGGVCTRLLLYFNTNKPHSFFFWQNTSCIRKPQVISGGEGVRTPCTLPLDPPLIEKGTARVLPVR